MDIYAISLSGLRSTDWNKIRTENFRKLLPTNKTKGKTLAKFVVNLQWYALALDLRYSGYDQSREKKIKAELGENSKKVYTYKHNLATMFFSCALKLTSALVGVSKTIGEQHYVDMDDPTELILNALYFPELDQYLSKASIDTYMRYVNAIPQWIFKRIESYEAKRNRNLAKNVA